jgi:hypothetical protein
MTDPLDLTNEPTEAELAALDAFLADESVWADPPAGLEDFVVATIAAEAAAAAPLPSDRPTDFGWSDQPDRARAPKRAVRRPPRRFGLVVGAAAAAAVILVAVLSLRPATGRTVELGAGPAGQPTNGAEARIEDQPNGTRILLDVASLPPAAPGTYYEAWLRKDPKVGVSIGTFHMRGGTGGHVELWAGVSPADYPLITVTIQQEGAGAESSGKVVLTGHVG